LLVPLNLVLAGASMQPQFGGPHAFGRVHLLCCCCQLRWLLIANGSNRKLDLEAL